MNDTVSDAEGRQLENKHRQKEERRNMKTVITQETQSDGE